MLGMRLLVPQIPGHLIPLSTPERPPFWGTPSPTHTHFTQIYISFFPTACLLSSLPLNWSLNPLVCLEIQGELFKLLFSIENWDSDWTKLFRTDWFGIPYLLIPGKSIHCTNAFPPTLFGHFSCCHIFQPFFIISSESLQSEWNRTKKYQDLDTLRQVAWVISSRMSFSLFHWYRQWHGFWLLRFEERKGKTEWESENIPYGEP